MILLITYEKRAFLKNYDSLYTRIKTADAWWHHMDNTWIIRTDNNVQYWYSYLASQITQEDRLLIIEVKPQYQGWLNKEAWKWLQSQFRKEGYNI